MTKTPSEQRGASLVEVLVALLILSFGMLSISGMLAYAVQAPKLSAFRATAMATAAGHIERMRANPIGFASGNYTQAYLATLPAIVACTYPNCDASSIATLDKDETNRSLRRDLPLGGFQMSCAGTDCSSGEGDLWVVWQEPSTFAALGSSTNDECPATLPFTSSPRCVHIRFKL